MRRGRPPRVCVRGSAAAGTGRGAGVGAGRGAVAALLEPGLAVVPRASSCRRVSVVLPRFSPGRCEEGSGLSGVGREWGPRAGAGSPPRTRALEGGICEQGPGRAGPAGSRPWCWRLLPGEARRQLCPQPSWWFFHPAPTQFPTRCGSERSEAVVGPVVVLRLLKSFIK